MEWNAGVIFLWTMDAKFAYSVGSTMKVIDV